MPETTPLWQFRQHPREEPDKITPNAFVYRSGMTSKDRFCELINRSLTTSIPFDQ